MSQGKGGANVRKTAHYAGNYRDPLQCVLRLIEAMLKAGSYGKGRLFPTERWTPQGGAVSPLLSNILLTPFDQEMRSKGYQLTRYADDWVVTCTSAAEARAAVAAALRILNELGVQLHPQKTRIVQVRYGFEFLGYKIMRGGTLRLPPGKIRSGAHPGRLYVYPREKSIRKFMDQVRALTKRSVPLKTKELIKELNPVLRGWGHHYKRTHVRLLFHRLDRWIVRRIWSHRNLRTHRTKAMETWLAEEGEGRPVTKENNTEPNITHNQHRVENGCPRGYVECAKKRGRRSKSSSRPCSTTLQSTYSGRATTDSNVGLRRE